MGSAGGGQASHNQPLPLQALRRYSTPPPPKALRKYSFPIPRPPVLCPQKAEQAGHGIWDGVGSKASCYWFAGSRFPVCHPTWPRTAHLLLGTKLLGEHYPLMGAWRGPSHQHLNSVPHCHAHWSWRPVLGQSPMRPWARTWTATCLRVRWQRQTLLSGCPCAGPELWASPLRALVTCRGSPSGCRPLPGDLSHQLGPHPLGGWVLLPQALQ